MRKAKQRMDAEQDKLSNLCQSYGPFPGRRLSAIGRKSVVSVHDAMYRTVDERYKDYVTAGYKFKANVRGERHERVMKDV